MERSIVRERSLYRFSYLRVRYDDDILSRKGDTMILFESDHSPLHHLLNTVLSFMYFRLRFSVNSSITYKSSLV